MFLIHKYSPSFIFESSINNQILAQLVHFASHEDIPHVIISGPRGGGKKTLVKFFLEALYGDGVNDISKTKYSISGSSKKNIIEVMQSNYHIVIEPTNTNHDKYILQEIIKQYAIHKTLNIFEKSRKFKTIVIYDIENLSVNSQAALRRTMEVYANTCRFVMVCNNLSKIFDPLRSRCRIFCVNQSSTDDIKCMIQHIAIKENIKLTSKNMNNILENCNGNMKEAIWILDQIRLNCYTTLPIYLALDNIVNIMMTVIKKNNIVTIFDKKIRHKIQDILTTTMSGSDIIIGIMDRLIKKINIDDININIIAIASDAEFNLVFGRRNITHIDDFVARIMQELIANKNRLEHLIT